MYLKKIFLTRCAETNIISSLKSSSNEALLPPGEAPRREPLTMIESTTYPWLMVTDVVW